MDDKLRAALGAVEAHAGGYVDDLAEFVRIPSVSTVPEHRPDLAAAAVWVAARLQRAGVPEVRTIDTPGNAVVVGRWQVDPALPTVVIYGHYDVQPPEPLELWESPPFEPEVRDGRLFGRGASDDKGAVLVPMQAVEAWAATAGAPPVNVTFVVEGEEEIGSPNLPTFLREHPDLLAGDLAISADGSMVGVDQPSLTVGNRGLAGCQIDLVGAASDLHSGGYGGAVPNPLEGLARILARMHDERGRVAVPGFYDGVKEPSKAVRDAIAALPRDEEAELAAVGLAAWIGEEGYSPLERLWVRPTFEVNGLWGGYQGEGVKTVLPNAAHAKVTCRLVAGQDPDRVLDAIEAYVQECTPPGLKASMQRMPGKARAYEIPLDHPSLAVAADSLEAVYGKKPALVWGGGTVPVASDFRSLLGMWCLYFAFGEPDNHVHAPNEFFRVAAMRRGTMATVRLLHDIARHADALKGA
jgi:acetylornithine deacetylase/succinyl-diaminopimelate desuccinylase-like protein